MSRSANSPTNPSPKQGVGEFGCPRLARTQKNAGSNPAALTNNPTSTIIAAAQSQSWS